MNNYSYPILGIIKEGFALSNGVKMTFNIALSILFFLAVGLSLLILFLLPSLIDVLNLIVTLILLPVSAGLFILAIDSARGLEIKVSQIFDYLGSMPSLIGAYLLVTIFTLLGFVALIIPGIYLAVAYSFTLPLIVDKKMGIWEAMELSRKTITKQWFRFFGLGLVTGFIIVISAIPLGIGLIWTIPASYLTYGLLYHRLFDEEE